MRIRVTAILSNISLSLSLSVTRSIRRISPGVVPYKTPACFIRYHETARNDGLKILSVSFYVDRI